MGAGLFEGDRNAAWTALLHAHARMVTRLSADLDDANLISLGSYDVLVQLSENNGRLRLKELVNRVVLSQPGLSRKVAKMEAQRLVERLDDPADGRGVIVHITRTGRAALRRASVVHIAGIEREFTSQISDQEAAVLAAVFGRLEVGDQADDPLSNEVGDDVGNRDAAADGKVGRDGGLLADRGVPDRRKPSEVARRGTGGAARRPGSRR
jgi:DNA-binding MarR family transcriptional regulator